MASLTGLYHSALTCPGSLVGACATCQRSTHKYGSGGSPR